VVGHGHRRVLLVGCFDQCREPDRRRHRAGLTFSDLGTGQNFGSIVIYDNSDFRVIDIVLNSNALTSINSASGLWAIGGRLGSSIGTVWAFGGSGGNVSGEYARQ